MLLRLTGQAIVTIEVAAVRRNSNSITSQITGKKASLQVSTARDVDNGALLSYYAASSGNFLKTFRDNLSVPSGGVKNFPPKKERAILYCDQ